MKGKCVACGYVGIIDRAHIKTRGAGAGWEEYEWMPLCRQCHTKQGALGWDKFVEKNSWVDFELEKRGWEIRVEFGVKKMRRKDG